MGDAPQRHYGMDWLRIGAFAILILYHVSMVFAPWSFHINVPHPVGWITLPMLGINAWRLTLLFVVSGYASRALLAKSPDAIGFARNRSARLLIPLAFGMAVIVPPQAWAELVAKHGYESGYGHFWTHDYFRFGKLGPLDLPTWNHLWFVVYLWVYTILLSAVASVPSQPRWQIVFDRAFGGAGVLAWPIVWLVAVHAWWFSAVGESHALFGDWVAHASYLPAFLFGFGLAGSKSAMAAIGRWWRWGVAIALLGYAVVLAVELSWPGDIRAPHWAQAPYRVAHALQQWGAIVALIGIADRYWNRDAAVRPMLTEAVFPFYIAHQTIIVLVAFWLLAAQLPTAVEFSIIVAATVAGCWMFYLVGRGIRPLRPLIGLRPAPTHRSAREVATSP